MTFMLFHAINPAAKIPYKLCSGVYFFQHVELVKLVTGEITSEEGLARWGELTQDQRDGVLRHSLGYRYPSTSEESRMDLTFQGALELSACLSGPDASAHASCIRAVMQLHSIGAGSLGQREPERGSPMDKPVTASSFLSHFPPARYMAGDGASRADPSAESASSLKLIPLDELHTGAKARQGLIGRDREQFLSTRDVIMALYGKAWGDAKGEKAASAKWSHIPDEDKEGLGEDLKTYRFADCKAGAPVIAFDALPEFCKLILKEKAKDCMPAVITIMQKYFLGDRVLIPAVGEVCKGKEDTISFDEVVTGASARTVVLDGTIHAYTREVIQYLTGNTPKRSCEIWRALPEDQVEELASFVKEYKFSGNGERVVPVISFPGILKLVMFLRGPKAFEHRLAIVKIMQRYHAGDASLIPEIQANAISDAPIAQMARESLAVEDGVQQSKKRQLEPSADMLQLEVLERKQRLDLTGLELYERKKKLDLEAAEREQELAERKRKFDMEELDRKQKLDLETADRKQKLDLETAEREHELAERKKKTELETMERELALTDRKQKQDMEAAERTKTFLLDSTEREMAMQAKLLGTYSMLCTGDQTVDDQGCKAFKGSLLRLVTQTTVKIEPVDEEEPADGSTIGEMLVAMEYNFDEMETRKIGIRVFKNYRATHGVTPSQRQIFTDGSKRVVNIYSHGDCTLIDQTVAEFLAEKA